MLRNQRRPEKQRKDEGNADEKLSEVVIFSLSSAKEEKRKEKKSEILHKIFVYCPRTASNGENTSIGGEQQEKESVCGFDRIIT